MPDVTYRRAPHTVCYWKCGRFICHNYATSQKRGATGLTCEVLDFFGEWSSFEALCSSKPTVDPSLLRRLVDLLVESTLLHRSDSEPSAAEIAMSSLDCWNPEAGFFHTTTKQVNFVDPFGEVAALQVSALGPMPAETKTYPGAAVTSLPTPTLGSSLSDVLLQRRSWRRFGDGDVALQSLGTLLGLTAGVQSWVESEQGRMALKTAPSGGARHSVELYVLACRVIGLAPGLYHYACESHALEAIKLGIDGGRVGTYLPGGDYWSGAGAVVFFSAVYPRVLWRYGFSRAYRAPLIEAGHLCQSFCLVATDLGLAPFCAMAIGDAAIESDLGLDGITESVIYAAGVGVRPSDVSWAPLPDGFEAPPRYPNPRFHSPRERD